MFHDYLSLRILHIFYLDRIYQDLIIYICNLLDEFMPKDYKHKSLIEFVDDRPGHDKRYSINPNKITSELGWHPKHTFEEGVKKTVLWYLKNRNWWK